MILEDAVRVAILGTETCCGMGLEERLALDPRFTLAPGAPESVDVLIVAGLITTKMLPVLKRLGRSLPATRQLVAFGNCAASGKLYSGYAHAGGLSDILGVDWNVPGCPPDPESLSVFLDALVSARRQRLREEDA